MFKLIVILISAIVFVNSCPGEKFVNSFGLDERTIYGWEVQTSSRLGGDTSCYGIFIGPRVFLTQSECVRYNGMSEVRIINSIYDSKAVTTQFSVSHSNIFTGKNLKKDKSAFDQSVALLITDEPVVPAEETSVNSFVKLPEDISDVDFSKCFMPDVSNSPIIVKSSCQIADENLTENSIKDFICSHDSPRTWKGNGLFCQLKENPDTLVLAGYVGSDFISDTQNFNNPETVINLSGLNIEVMSL